MKYFISHPMSGKTTNEILQKREELKKKILSIDSTASFIDNFIRDISEDANPLLYLGTAISKMADADVAYFSSDWRSARGCIIEHLCADLYKIPKIIEEN